MEIPDNVLEVAAVYDDHGEDGEAAAVASPHTGGKFTPVKVHTEPEKFAGVAVKQFPKDTDSGDIMDFLIRSGLPESAKESVMIKSNGAVTIKNLENHVCLALIENIHNKKNFNRKLFCNGFIPLTPEKPVTSSEASTATSATSTVTSQASSPATGNSSPAQCPPALDHQASQATSSVKVSPAKPFAGSPSQSIGEKSFIVDHPEMQSDEAFLRRHSLSLRTPPLGSLADDILYSAPSLLKTRNILSEIKQMSEQLSDFGSCISSNSEDEKDLTWNSKKKKRKAKESPPDRNYFLKKMNSENQNLVSPIHPTP